MQVRKIAAWTALPVALTVGLAACGGDGGSDSGASNPNGVVSIGIGEPQHLIPSNTNESNGNQVLAALYTPLVEIDAEGKAHELGAESITTSDSKVWTIKLKDGYTFHNGEKVTADSFINAWNYGAYAPNAQLNNFFYERIDGYAALNPADPDGEAGAQKAPTPTTKTLSGLKKVNDNEFTVTLSAPFADFKTMLNYSAFYPLPKAAFAADGSIAKGFEDAPVGNGPYKMSGTWKHDQLIQVVRYDDYTGDKAKIGGVDFRVYQQPTAQYADAVANKLDVITQIPTENLSTVEGDFGDRFQQSPTSSFQFLAFPTFDPTFSKVEVRKAISMAIDRDEQIKTIFQDTQTAARSFVSPVVAGARDNTCGDACVFDPAKAKEMYTAAGGPAKLTISYNADGPHKDWVEATCNQLKANLGVDCTAQPEPKFADLLTKLDQKKPVGMFRLGWSFDYPSMENYLGPLYSTNGSSNYYGYSNKQFDTLVAEGSAATSSDAAIAKWQAAEDILAKDLPVLPMRFGQNNFAHSTNVSDVSMNLFGRVDLLKIQSVSG